MWRNYVTVGLRALAKNKTYAFINIFGLAVGLAACLMILLYVRYEASYDNWLPDAERTFQFQTLYEPTESGGEEHRLQMTNYSAAAALAKDFAQVERTAYVNYGGGYVLRNGEATLVEQLRYTDGNLLDVLRLPLIRGDAATALARPGQLIISESEARRQFGATDVVGRTLTVVEPGSTSNTDYQVAGVFRDLPPNSHLSFNIIARIDPAVFYRDNPNFLRTWNSQAGWVYVRLREGARVDEINAQLPAWERRNIPDEVTEGRRSNPGDNQNWRLVNVRDAHLSDAQDAAMRPGNDMRTVVTFSIIAMLILGMACVNFTNLATARASQRAREVALRKVLGASRRQLIGQFLGESIMIAAIAMLIAMAMTELFLPLLNAFLQARIELHYLGLGGVLIPVVLLVILVGAAGGLYPAFYLSRFQPAQILRANKSAADSQGTGVMRNVLVVGQFAISIGLIVCTMIVYAQTVYARTTDAGYRRDGLLQVQMIGGQRLEQVIDTLKREIGAIPGVTAVGRSTIAVDPDGNSVTEVQLPGQSAGVALGVYGIDPQFFPAMGMPMRAGRNFDERQARDDATTPSPVDMDAERALVSRGLNVIVTEEAARRLGFRTPQDAIGKEIRVGLTLPELGMVSSTIIGVAQDARFRSLRDPLQPTLYFFQRTNFRYLVIRYSGEDAGRLREQVEAIWKRILPDVPFRARYAEELVQDLYEADEARAQIFAGFALLSIVVACLGLFGLAAFTAERRTKEIGIRKVLGARTRDIIGLLTWQFSKPVIVANLIGAPAAWWLMRSWLNEFDSRVTLTWQPFVLAAFVALAIAIGTIAGHAIRVARSNPIHALRYE